LAEGFGRTRKAKRALGFKLSRCGTSEALQQARNAALVSEFLKYFYAFAVQGSGSRNVFMFPRQVAEIREGAGDSPPVVMLAKNHQSLFL
jgi:hypothetical protein